MPPTINDFFDEVYVVNLKRDLPQRLQMRAQLQRLGISFTLWEATDGSAAPHVAGYEAYAQQPVGQIADAAYAQIERKRGTKLIHSPGAWGYMQTYLGLLRHLQARGVGSALVLEDDVLLDHDFAPRFAALTSQLPANWMALLLGASQYGWDAIDDHIARARGLYEARPNETCGSFALGLRADALPPLIAAAERMIAPFDFHALAELYASNPGRCLVAYPALAMPDVAQSRIRGGRDQRAHAAKMRWDVDRFDYPPKRPLVSVIAPPPALVAALATGSIAQAVDVRVFVREGEALRPLPLPPARGIVASSESAIAPSPDAGAGTPATAATTAASPTLSAADLPPFVREADLCMWFGAGAEQVDADAFLAAVEAGLMGIETEGPACFVRRPMRPTDQSELVSIIIPTHGRSDSLEAAIHSALAQTHAAVEVLVVDDNLPGSPEAENIRSLRQGLRDPRLRWLHHADNRGGAAARNTALMASQGAYFSFLDDDDTYEPQKIELSLAKLRALGPGFGAVYCGFLGGNASRRDPQRFRAGNLQLEVLALEYASHYLNMDTALYRRQAIARLGGFDETLARHQDLDLNARFFEHYQIGCVEAWLVRIRPDRGKGIHLLDGPKLLATKRQFLAKFSPLIAELPAAAQQRIWLAHNRELARYFRGEAAFAREALGALDPVLQRLLLLEQRTSLALSPCGQDARAEASQANARRWRGPRLAILLLGGVVAGTLGALHHVRYAPTSSIMIVLAAGLVVTNIVVIDQVRRVGARTLRNVYAIQRALAGERAGGKNTDASSQ